MFRVSEHWNRKLVSYYLLVHTLLVHMYVVHIVKLNKTALKFKSWMQFLEWSNVLSRLYPLHITFMRCLLFSLGQLGLISTSSAWTRYSLL